MSVESSLEALVREQAAMIAELRVRIESIEQTQAAGAGSVGTSTSTASTSTASTSAAAFGTESTGTVAAGARATEGAAASVEARSRRGFLKLAGATAVGAAAVVAGTAGSAAAADGGTFNGNETVYNNNGTNVDKAGVHGTFSPNGGGIGVRGTADIGASAAGVLGIAASGYGVYGTSASGYAVYAASNGRLGFDAHLVGTNAPTSFAYKLGDIVMNTNGDTFSCVVEGSGGSARFRKLAGPQTAGQLHFLPSVQRVVFTGTGTGIAAGTLAVNTNRITSNLASSISIPGGPIPTAELNGALASVTVYPPGASGTFVGSGYVGVAGLQTATPSVTWATGQAFQTGLVATNFNNGTLVLAAFGTACEVTVDIIGYFR